MGGFADAADLYGGIGCFGLSGGTGGRNFPEAVRCGVLLYGGDGILGVCGAPGSLCRFRIASRRDGGLCGGLAFGGEGIQRALLEEEGVVFLPDGRVDMARCGWLK